MGQQLHIVYTLCQISNNVDSQHTRTSNILFAFKIPQKIQIYADFDTKEINNYIPRNNVYLNITKFPFLIFHRHTKTGIKKQRIYIEQWSVCNLNISSKCQVKFTEYLILLINDYI